MVLHDPPSITADVNTRRRAEEPEGDDRGQSIRIRTTFYYMSEVHNHLIIIIISLHYISEVDVVLPYDMKLIILKC